MKTKIIAILVFASLMTKLNAQNHDKVGLLEKPVPVSSVRNITGFFGHRMEVNRNAYLKHFPIDKYVDFIVNRQHSAWDWTQAEQHGKWIESAYLSAVQGDDKELLIKAESVLNRIIDSQEANGYVGATAKSFRSPERPVRGMDAYDYILFSMPLSQYMKKQEIKKALTAAEKLADYFLQYFGPGKLEFLAL